MASPSIEKTRLSQDKLRSPNEANLNRERFCLQLVEAVAPLLNDELYELYKKAIALGKKSKSPWQRIFQTMLSECPQWDDDIVQGITDHIVSKVPWFRQVVKQMVIQEIYVLMSSRYDQPTEDINFEFNLPSNLELMRTILIRVCDYMRGFVYLYSHEVGESEMAKNAGKAERKIQLALQRAIVSFVPTSKIVEAHLNPAPPPPKEGTAEDQMTLLQSEKPESNGAAEVSDTPQSDAHVDIERNETLAAAAANDATSAAKTAVQSAQIAMTAANDANEALPKEIVKRRKLKFQDF